MRLRDRILLGPRWIGHAWRRSLTVRVVATTLIVSAVVVSVLGLLLLSRVTTGLLASRQSIAVSEAAAGLSEAQRVVDAASAGTTAPSPARLVDSVVTSLAARAGAPGQFDLLLLAVDPRPDTPERGTNLVSVSSVPQALREAVNESQRQSWTYSTIRYLDSRSVPGLVVGAPLTIPGVGPYELYYLFPLAEEQSTLDLVRSAVVGAGFILIVLLFTIAWLVTRQVVSPVRAAARTASRLASGHLSERMRVRGEDDLAQLARAFNDMAANLQRQIKQLESLSRVQQRFVSDVSHELRTPLTTIRMAADVMFEHREDFDAPTARAAELLQDQLDRFEELLVDLLEISRFDAGAAVLEAEPIDLVALARRAVNASQPLSTRLARPIDFEEPEHPAVVTADARRIERIIRNLIVNGLEHGDARGIEVRIGASESAVAVTVRDHGVGLRPGESSLVFNRFWRADPSRARTTGGSGLGLAIALEDARLHGGWLEAAGEPGRGAVFRLTLPRVAGAALDRAPLPLDADDAEEADARVGGGDAR